jgi:hypothetical protein
MNCAEYATPTISDAFICRCHAEGRTMAVRLGFGSTVADIVRLVGSELVSNPAIVGHAGQLARSVVRAGRQLSGGRNAGDLVHDVRRAARRHPALFVVGGIALGIALARLAKLAKTSDTSAGGVHIPVGRYTIVPAPERRIKRLGV